MRRDLLAAAAERALRNPQHAPAVAREILGLLDSFPETGAAPAGYVYAGATRLTARVRDLAVEQLPEQTPPGPEIYESNARSIPIKLPFDCLIQGVSGFAMVRTVSDSAQPLTIALSSAREGRDLFAVQWDLDGETIFQTDGRGAKYWPASCVVGTARHPRPMAWTVRRNQTINVRFRSMLNAITQETVWTENQLEYPTLAEASITFHALNLGAP